MSDDEFMLITFYRF